MASLKDMMYPPVDWNDPYAKGEVTPYQAIVQQRVQQTPKPGFIERLKGSLIVPSAPTHYKQRKSQEFLRGLVQGFKGPQAAATGKAGREVGPDGLTAYERENLKLRRDSENRQMTMLEMLRPLREAQTATIPADDKRATDQVAETARHNRAMEAIAAQNSAIAMGNLQERRKAAGLEGEMMKNWPPRWKSAYQSSLRAIAAQDAEARQNDTVPYDPSIFQSQVDILNSHYLNMEVQATGKVPSTYFMESPAVTGKSTTAGPKTVPATKGSPAKKPQVAPDPLGIR